jgi:polysaccharide deacetylase family protein (PEP-CTERM system associated)
VLQRKLIFTMDVEDWFHAENIKKYVGETTYSSLPRVYDVLDYLDSVNARGTFFVLGLLADSVPALIREVKDRGHEIASHGLSHRMLGSLSEVELLRDLRESKDRLEQLTQSECIGYRSPCFSKHPCLDEMLIATGYKYKSCELKASFHDRYGSPGFGGSQLVRDFALPSATVFGKSVPASGGGYFRLYPASFQKFLLAMADAEPLIFYCHPWDFDPCQPVPSSVPRILKVRHSIGSKRAFRKLSRFKFDNVTLGELVYTS